MSPNLKGSFLLLGICAILFVLVALFLYHPVREKEPPRENNGGLYSQGCGIPHPKSGYLPFRAANRDRIAYISLPKGYKADKPYRAVFYWHALNQKIENLVPSPLERAAGNNSETIFIYPQGLVYGSIGLGWDPAKNGIDIPFFDTLYQHIMENYCVDKSRLFSYGYSFGALFTASLACFRGEHFRAASAISGRNAFEGACGAGVDLLLAHGIHDDHPLVPYEAGRKSAQFWMQNKNCQQEPLQTDDGCQTFTGCSTRLTWCPFEGDHRYWRAEPFASWKFFSAY